MTRDKTRMFLDHLKAAVILPSSNYSFKICIFNRQNLKKMLAKVRSEVSRDNNKIAVGS